MSDHHHFNNMQNLKQQFPLFNNNLEIINHFPDLINPTSNYNLEFATALNFQSSIMGFSPENFITPQEQFPGNLSQDFPENSLHQDEKKILESRNNGGLHEAMKWKIIDQTPESSLTTHSENATKRRTNCVGRQKRKRSGEDEEEEKPREVVHVRAKRGQATDSHSLAERVRRGKINERLKCLQEIVPGCYKTMGMAVMLDEIINYVQSLQNQIEFLSMKLSAASTNYDFNSGIENLITMQMKMQKQVREGCEGLATSNQLIIPFDHNLIGSSSYPSLPHNT